MAQTIDDRLKNGSKEADKNVVSNSHKTHHDLESRISSAGKALKFAGKAALTGGLIAATYSIVGVSSIITAAGNGVGYIIEKAKGREKIDTEELNKEIGTGGILGVVGYGLYSLIDFIPNYNLPLKIAKTIAFNPVMLAPYVAFYQAFTYLRDKVGIAKSVIGMLNLKIFRYLKDAYHNEVKPNFKKSMKKIMYLMPIHFGSINYVTSIPARVAIGAFNDIAFRLFQGKKKNEPYAAGKYNKSIPYSTPAAAYT